jgi:hypothetical protein
MWRDLSYMARFVPAQPLQPVRRPALHRIFREQAEDDAAGTREDHNGNNLSG